VTRPGLTAGALGPSIISLNTNKSSSSSSSAAAGGTPGRGPRVTRSLITVTGTGVCLLLQDLLQSVVFITAVPIIKLFAWGEGDSGGHVLRETTSRGLCGLICPSRTGSEGARSYSACRPLYGPRGRWAPLARSQERASLLTVLPRGCVVPS
jgi:hypothetical protein